MSILYTNSLPGRTVQIADKDWLWFSGTAYLGMGYHAAFRQFLLEGMAQYGTNFGSSRNNNLRLQIYEEAETALVQFVGAPAALTVSSGMLVGQLVTKWIDNTILKQASAIRWYAPNVHPALWGADYQSVNELLNEWFARLPERTRASEAKHIVIATDSVGSPQVSAIPWDWVSELPDNKQITILVDDSHGLGVFGTKGEGIYQEIAKRVTCSNHKIIVVSSLNKALGIPAGAVLADPEVISSIRQTPMFAGASPSPPAYLYALKKTCESGIYEMEHQKMLLNAQYFEQQVKDLDLFSYINKYPAFCSLQSGLHEFLKEHQILTASFSYPTPQDAPVTRLVVSSLHTPDDLNILAACCHDYISSLG